MAKKKLTVEEQLKRCKRKLRLVLAILIAFAGLTGFYTYLNFDYLVFKHFITSSYIYTGTLDEVFKKELKQDIQGKYFTYFDDLVISTVTRRIREENNDRYTYLYTPEQYKKYEQEEKTEALQSEVKTLTDDTVYMRLTNFSKYTRQFMKDQEKNLKSRPNLILDLRDNYGGDIDAMVAMSGMFLKEGSVVAVDKMRLLDKTYKAKGGKVLGYQKIIILQNKNSASASENMIAALKDNLPNVTLIGEKTYGKGIGQYTMPLKKGFAVKATILLWYTPKGVNIQGQGIQPDIPYDPKGDGILNYALDQVTR